MNGWATAVAFYTRVPVRNATPASRDLAAAAPWFPVVGAAIGAVVAGLYAGLAGLLPGVLAATLAVAAAAVLTGAFHEDGLADVADAFAGGWTAERRLEILEDPRLGTFGVVALIAGFVTRVTTIAALDAYAALAVLPAVHALSRAPAVVLMRRQRSARADGLAATLARDIGGVHEGVAVALALVISTALIAVWTLPAVVLTVLVSAGMAVLAKRKIGGTNGDVLGATQQISELAILVLAVAVVHNGWGDLAWWAT